MSYSFFGLRPIWYVHKPRFRDNFYFARLVYYRMAMITHPTLSAISSYELRLPCDVCHLRTNRLDHPAGKSAPNGQIGPSLGSLVILLIRTK